MPGTGYLAACVPGSFDAWLTLLRDYGTWELADVLAFAIGYARDGYPMTPGIARAIRALRAVVDDVGGAVAQTSARLRNPLLADTYERLARSGGATREGRIDAARDAWYRGFVAEAIVRAVAEPAVDSSGEAHAGVLDGRRPGGVRGDLRGAGRRSTSAAGRCSRPGRGVRGRCSCSSSRCSTDSTSARSSASSTCTAWSSARSSRSPTARRSTATRRRSPLERAALAGVRATSGGR